MSRISLPPTRLAVECRDLVIRRGSRILLKTDYFSIAPGDTVAIMGKNGCGKSTLLQVINGLIPADGEVLICGEPIGPGSKYLNIRRKIAAVYQNPMLLDTTVYNNVAAGLRFRGLDKKTICERSEFWMERLGITHLTKRWARALSGGEGQKVSLARALACNPDILMLDEPFSALDQPTKYELLFSLRNIMMDVYKEEKSLTTILVSHSFDEVMSLAKQLYLIKEDTLLDLGKPSEVTNKNLPVDVKVFFGNLNEIVTTGSVI